MNWFTLTGSLYKLNKVILLLAANQKVLVVAGRLLMLNSYRHLIGIEQESAVGDWPKLNWPTGCI